MLNINDLYEALKKCRKPAGVPCDKCPYSGPGCFDRLLDDAEAVIGAVIASFDTSDGGLTEKR